MQPAEFAQAAMTAALMGAVAVVSIVLPGAVVFAWLGAVPMGVLSYRHRVRVGFAAAIAACLIAFLVAGFGGLVSAFTCSYMGAISGQVKRRGRGAATMLAVAAAWGVVAASFCVGLFASLVHLREVVIGAIGANVGGLALLTHDIPVLGAATGGFNRAVQGWLVHWPLFFEISVWLLVAFGTSFGWRVLGPVLRRIEEVTDLSIDGSLSAIDNSAPAGPLPVALSDVSYRYPGADRDALAPVNLDVDFGEHVAVTGPNGSGKSTLMRILAGSTPTGGRVERPAGVGLGQVGGTALVLQHPESQILGLRMADDVVWGLPSDREVDIDGLLNEVGLGGMGHRDTAGLSGGELQRLAVASALARQPAMLVADEVTTMVDQGGRESVLKVLDGLTQHHRLGLVHITHYPGEAASADRVVQLGSPRISTPNPMKPKLQVTPSGTTVLDIRNVSFDYAPGTVWSRPVLQDISLSVSAGDGVLLCGGNGSGKSTLAWILAGLLSPTSGECLLDGRPAAEQVGSVALCFQAARLQLLRGHAGAAVAALAGLAGTDTHNVARALASVGLEPGIAGVLVDRLSGGQLRRVALAGLLARSPRVLILDEPLAGLDVDAQSDLIDLLLTIRAEGQTVIVISHDVASLSPLCPRTIRLERGALAEQETRR
ncbi:ATP-binding cassette domain-containing protein [Mycobacterium sp. CBMA293]|uniref:ABC transporter ATP-binding protein n=2 Tax=Mycolicibacterium TaxID=1866885 RepID=UPI0012DBCEDA|nr:MULTISPECIES: ATP-binding cassette domain-containing protein [unclassified Mycolicibacterium]MUL49561.1 ATP-binding cassette domain-containing protein [Mycolicibacterium sp. CBMA 360]MUL61657.1 ATP-binding cassette domain-containing protein [Mycolicibacterium sp. CBMA 335]MUL74393.1 ATP-binding cassette domain-containing protein [Mycolicibacterium sp. CBMA 311]MUL96670.1 ATP-binding cassette domain-containing protein [Mycolicibacterium sp. CBMA 230]MUM04169.1 cobalt ABC transporter ATP-bind